METRPASPALGLGQTQHQKYGSTCLLCGRKAQHSYSGAKPPALGLKPLRVFLYVPGTSTTPAIVHLSEPTVPACKRQFVCFPAASASSRETASLLIFTARYFEGSFSWHWFWAGESSIGLKFPHSSGKLCILEIPLNSQPAACGCRISPCCISTLLTRLNVVSSLYPYL